MAERPSDPVVVCGAGAAGMASAIAAARAGSPVLVVERGDDVGGTMADALLHTLAGLYDSRGCYLNEGLSRELAERLLAADSLVRQRRMGKLWVLSVDPDLYRAVAREWLESEPLITLLLRTRVTGVALDGGRVVEAELSGSGGGSRVAVRSLIDATGSAAVVRLIDEALALPETEVAAGGWIFRMRGVAPDALRFPRNVALVRELRERAAAGHLPAECGQAWIDVGIHEDEAFVKLFVPLQPGWQRVEAHGGVSAAALRLQHRVVEFLGTQSGFEGAFVSGTGKLGIRDGGRARGEYTLTADDVLGLARFEDAACRCAWPVEYWDSRAGVSLTYLPDGEYYEVPMRSLKVATLENVWAAGKSLSADPRAQASARCVGTCWAMGAAAGSAAATSGGARAAAVGHLSSLPR